MPFTFISEYQPSAGTFLEAVKTNLSKVFAKQRIQNIEGFECCFSDISVQGYLTKPSTSQCTKLKKENCLAYLNKRPINLPKRLRLLFNELYRQYGTEGLAFVCLNFTTQKPGLCDFNVSVDKREVYFQDEP